MSNEINFAALKEPFPVERVSWRVGSTNGDKTKGMALAYIDARDVMDRLDAVVGAGQWRDEYPTVGAITVCRIGIYHNGEWIYKEDGAGATDVEADEFSCDWHSLSVSS